MSKFVNAVMVGLVAFLGLLSVFWYMSEGTRVDEVRARSVGVKWDRFDAGGANVLIMIKFHNPHASDARLVRLEQEAFIDAIPLQRELTTVSATIPARGDETVYFLRFLPNPTIERWFGRQENETTFIVRGEAQFEVATKRVAVPFDYASTWEGNLAGNVAQALVNCGQTSPLCVDSASAQWTRAAGEVRLPLELVFSNTADYPLRIQDTGMDLVLNGTRVASGVANESLIVPPMGTERLRLTLRVDNGTFVTWWRSHVAGCETSPVEMALRLTQVAIARTDSGETTDGEAYRIAWQFGGAPFRTEFVCPSS